MDHLPRDFRGNIHAAHGRPEQDRGLDRDHL